MILVFLNWPFATQPNKPISKPILHCLIGVWFLSANKGFVFKQFSDDGNLTFGKVWKRNLREK